MSFWSLTGLVELALFCAGGATAIGLPPVRARPKNAATSVASHQLVQRADAAERADRPDEASALLRRAVAADPTNLDARVTLAGSLLERHPDETLAILTQLRDAGCHAGLQAVTDFVGKRHESTADATLRDQLEALARDAHGRITRLSRAADAVWKAFERKEWRLLAPYVREKVRIKTTGTLSDDPGEDVSVATLSRAQMQAWFETQTGLDLHRDEAWYCTERCCEYWSWKASRNDLTNYLQKICFDTTGPRPILTRLEWESG